MKIRQGFVSNSSSASFVITVKLPLNEFKELFKEEGKLFYDYNSGFAVTEDQSHLGYKIEEDSLGNTCMSGFTVMHNDDDDFGPMFKKVQDVCWDKNVPFKVEVSDES